MKPHSSKSRLPFYIIDLARSLATVLHGYLISVADSQKWTHSFDVNGLQNQLNDRGIAFVPFSANPV